MSQSEMYSKHVLEIKLPLFLSWICIETDNSTKMETISWLVEPNPANYFKMHQDDEVGENFLKFLLQEGDNLV